MSVDVNVDYAEGTAWDTEMPARLAWLRENDPVHWSDKSGLWVVTRYEDVAAVSKNQELFTSGEGVRPGNPAKIGLIDEAEPRHGMLRNLINKGFSPRMVKVLEQKFRAITKEALDKIAKRGECDFVADVAVPLPLLLIAEMIGIRREDFDRFHHWSDTMIAADGYFDDPDVVAAAGQSFMEYSIYVSEIIEERRKNPQDDLISILVTADDEGILGRFDLEERDGGDPAQLEAAKSELVMLCVILMVAGNETTRNALSGGMQLLIENPDQRQKLIDDPSLLKIATEEIVRLVTPVHSFSRTVTKDTVLRGKTLKKGDRVLIIYKSANVDERQYVNPEVFDVTRDPQHLGFGIGSHFCLGANLARMEVRVAFEELLRRFPDMEFAAGGPVIRPSALVRTCVEMRVKFTPES